MHEPVTRGTYSLVSSCVFPLVLSVWTAIHLNIPEQAPGARQFLRKLAWLVVGLLAPEAVTFTAWNQYADAARLVTQVNKAARPKDSAWRRFCQRFLPNFPGTESRYVPEGDVEMVRPSIILLHSCSLTGALRHQGTVPLNNVGSDWNLVHGFYAVMGGYVIDVSNSGDQFLPNNLQRLTLTTEGVRFLLEHAPELIPCLSEADINDKSKADGLAKLLVALQAAWFCLQCLARNVQSLPTSLLEITTGGHALYTLFTYVLWAYKPMDIGIPTVILANEKLRHLCAYMFMCSRISGKTAARAHGMANDTHVEFDILSVDPLPQGSAMSDVVGFRQTLAGTGFSLSSASLGLPPVTLDAVTARRWRLAWWAVNKGLSPTSTEYVVEHTSNLPTFNGKHGTARLIFAFLFAEVIYAGIHATGWNAAFASPELQTAWRVACCIIGGGGVFVAVFGFSFAFADMGKPYWDQSFSAVLWVGALEFAIRMFLLIEAVLNVAVLPAEVYDLPRWPFTSH